jgi:hypothetical protein
MSDIAPRPEPWVDPIVAEVREAREQLFAEAGYDIHELFRRAREREELSGHPIVRRVKPEPGSEGEAAQARVHPTP